MSFLDDIAKIFSSGSSEFDKDPWGTVGTAITKIGGAVTSIANPLMQARAQASEFGQLASVQDFNAQTAALIAKLARQNAEQIRMANIANEANRRANFARTMGSFNATRGASGLVADSSTFEDYRSDMVAQNELEQLIQRWNTETQAKQQEAFAYGSDLEKYQYERSAADYRNRARASKSLGKTKAIDAVGDALGTLGSIGKLFG